MSLGITWVDLQGLMQNFNAPVMMSQVAQGAAGIAQYLGASVIKSNCVFSGAERIAHQTRRVRQQSDIPGQCGQQSVVGVSQAKCRVKGHALLKLRPRLGHGVLPPALHRNRPNGLMVVGPCILIFRALTAYVGNFRAGEFGFKFRNNPARDIFLQIDSRVTTAIEATAPQNAPRCRVGELCRDPKDIILQTHAALDYKTNAELKGDFRQSDIVSTKGKRRRAGDQ